MMLQPKSEWEAGFRVGYVVGLVALLTVTLGFESCGISHNHGYDDYYNSRAEWCSQIVCDRYETGDEYRECVEECARSDHDV
ncbi:MAG: hypothetical protein ACXAB9_15325 [Candidatus Thorarchaeota archaeon]